MKIGYLGYVESLYRGNEKDGYVMSAGVVEFDLDSVDKEDLDFIKSQDPDKPGEGLEITVTKAHFTIDQHDRKQGNKFEMHYPYEINIYGDEVKSSLKEAWQIVYDNRKLIFQDIFESSVSL